MLTDDIDQSRDLKEIVVTRNARHAMEKSGITLFDLFKVLKSPDSSVRADPVSGNYVLRYRDLRVAYQEETSGSIKILTVFQNDDIFE